MAQMIAAIGRLVHRNDGQDLIEYALLVGLIGLVALVGISALGSTIQTVFWSGIGQAI